MWVHYTMGGGGSGGRMDDVPLRAKMGAATNGISRAENSIHNHVDYIPFLEYNDCNTNFDKDPGLSINNLGKTCVSPIKLM